MYFKAVCETKSNKIRVMEDTKYLQVIGAAYVDNS